MARSVLQYEIRISQERDQAGIRRTNKETYAICEPSLQFKVCLNRTIYLTSRSSGFARVMTPVRGLTTKWSVSCMPYFTGDPSGSWPFRTNTSFPTLVDSESGKPVGYPPASRIGGSFTLLPAKTTRKKCLFSRVCCIVVILITHTHTRKIPSRVPQQVYLFPSLTSFYTLQATRSMLLAGKRDV